MHSPLTKTTRAHRRANRRSFVFNVVNGTFASPMSALYRSAVRPWHKLLTIGTYGNLGATLVTSPFLLLLEESPLSFEKRAFVAGSLVTLSTAGWAAWQWVLTRLVVEVRKEKDDRISLAHYNRLGQVRWLNVDRHQLSTDLMSTRIVRNTIFYSVHVENDKTYLIPADDQYCDDYNRLMKELNPKQS